TRLRPGFLLQCMTRRRENATVGRPSIRNATMNPLRWSFRTAFLLGFVICVALLGYALYAEQQLHLMPCNLCILQRVAFIWMGLWFRVGGRWAYVVLVLIGAVFGVAMAGRQLWLQSLPADQIPACGAGFDMLLAQLKGHYIPLSQFI